jgi:hypothetical protein
MRAKEFIIENRYGGIDGKLHPHYDQANPGAITGHDINKYYDLYRAGILMGADEESLKKLDAASWINDQAYFGAYTEVDRNKILAALKKLKLKPKILIEPGSLENLDTNKISPMKSFKGYPR